MNHIKTVSRNGSLFAQIESKSPKREVGLKNRDLIRVALLVACLSGAYFLLTSRAPEMSFMELSSPSGYRELVLGDARRLNTPELLTIGIPQQQSAATTKLKPSELCSALFEGPGSLQAGPTDRAVRLAMFSDYRCAYCRTLTKILSDLQSTGTVRIVYKEWPILGDSSVLAARAALAAAKQGRYEVFHKRLMESRFVPTQHYIEALAKELGLDVPRLLIDLSSQDVSTALQRSADLAATFGLTGTPALVVGRTLVRGAISRDELDALIKIEAAPDTTQVC